MNLRLLGPVEAIADGHPVALGPPKQRALLAMLALESGRTVSVDRLIDGLWGDEPPASAAKMVQLYVSQLRRVMNGNGAEIVRHGRGYELSLTDGELDVERFTKLLELGRPRDALALWRGNALGDLADEPFAAVEIGRLEELRLQATEQAIDADLEAGRHAEVIAELETLAAAHPLRERLQAQRMLALYRAGRQSEALAAYREARDVLVGEIGVEPGAELQRLQRAILEQDSALDLASADAADDGSPVAGRSVRARRGWLLIIAASLPVAALAVFGLTRLGGTHNLGQIGENAVGLIEPGSGRITTQFNVGRGAAAMAAGAGSVWVANRDDGTVTRLQEGRQEVVTIDVGGEPTGLAFGAGSLWVADGGGRTVAQVDPYAKKVVQRFDVGNAANAVAVGYGAVWVTAGVDGTVARIDLARGFVTDRVAVGPRPTAIAVGAGGIWVASEVGASIFHIDPRSRTVVARIPTGNSPSSIAVGAGAVWVANRMDGNVSRIDPATDRVTDTVRVGREPDGVVVGRDGVWVANGGDGTLARLDPDTARVDQRVRVGNSPAALVFAGGRLWSTALPATQAHRGGRLRVSLSAPPARQPYRIDPSSLDPLATLEYDGLVGYRRAGGSAGGALVADLARDLPDAGPDGRTYVFRLRPGIRFSNGRPLAPADVRASVERLVAVQSGTGEKEYLPIRGASRCSPKRCDLSTGIKTDAVAETITIRLVRPDAEFLHKLTNALVVPAGSPLELAAKPLPGTGPYMTQRWDPRRGGVLARNPHFRMWSADRPAGFADEIAIRLELPAKQVVAIDHGTEDVAVFRYGLEQVTPARTWFGTHFHSDGAAQTWFLFLNTRVPPFNDVRVRRALNYAVDRGRVAAILGSPVTQTPTCQLLPPGSPGYIPSCPFSLGSSPAGVWTAPDLAKARKLIADSGTRGMKVQFWGSRPWEPLSDYFRTLLRRLGYRSSARTFDDLHLIMDSASRSRAQLGLWAWIADSAGPLNFLGALVSCAGSVNFSRFCDPSLDAAMKRAAAAPGAQAIEKWRRVEAQLAEQSPTVPLVNEKALSLTGKRVGNYQYHPIWGPLLDEMWVK